MVTLYALVMVGLVVVWLLGLWFRKPADKDMP